MSRIRSATLLVLALLSTAPLAAQREGGPREPRRPRLEAGADTADAHAYYGHGIGLLERDPRAAADAFYWAARLDPTWADPLYARRIALLMSDPRRLESYMDGNRRTIESPAIRQIDSLQYRALVLNPFLYRRLDRQLFKFYVKSSYRRGESKSMRSVNDRAGEAELEHAIESWLLGAGPWMRGWNSYSSGRFPDALRYFATALRGSRNKSDIHADRARIFFLTGDVDSAQVQMTRAIEQMRNRDKDDLVFLYESKALYEHSIGMIEEQKENPAGAREAYARALQEDLAYHPAHTRLALLALAEGDTATALSELDLAVQIQGEDAPLRLTYGTTLAVARKLPEAEEQLRRAMALEPYFATPYYVLGRVLDAQGKSAEAVTQYRAFLERASRRDPQRSWVEQRMAALGGTP